MAHFKIPTIKTKPRKKISIDGLSEFQWNEIEAKVEIRSGSFGVAYKADFNGNTVVAKRLRSERPAEIALFAKEGRLLNTLHHENVIEIKGCCFSPCALMLSYQYFDFRPFGIEKEVNNLLQFLEVVDSFEETSLAVLSPTVQKIAKDISRALTYLHDQDVTHRDLKPGNVLVSNGHYSGEENSEQALNVFKVSPIVCKLTDFGESRSQLIQTSMAIHSRTNNLEKGTLPYMAPELILNNLEGVSVEDLKSIDVWALGMTLFVPLNPDLQGPYLIEHREKALMPYRKVIEGKMRGRERPRMSEKYNRKQASEWNKVEKAFHHCIVFDASARPAARDIQRFLEDQTTDRRCVSLVVSQQSAVEQFHQDMLACCDEANDPHNPNIFLEHDATNACSFLSLAISDSLLSLSNTCTSDTHWEQVAEIAHKVIIELPSLLNNIRDRTLYYDVLEALQILKTHILIPQEVVLYENIVSDSCVFSPEGRHLPRSALASAPNQATSVYLYTCVPYVFLVGVLNGCYFALDTGMLTIFSSTDSASCDCLCHWIWTRLADGAVQDDDGQSLSAIIRTSPASEPVQVGTERISVCKISN